MYNKTIDKFLDDYIVYYKPKDNVTTENIEVFSNLFIPKVSMNPYQLKANFFGVDNNFASNKFLFCHRNLKIMVLLMKFI